MEKYIIFKFWGADILVLSNKPWSHVNNLMGVRVLQYLCTLAYLIIIQCFLCTHIVPSAFMAKTGRSDLVWERKKQLDKQVIVSVRVAR